MLKLVVIAHFISKPKSVADLGFVAWGVKENFKGSSGCQIYHGNLVNLLIFVKGAPNFRMRDVGGALPPTTVAGFTADYNHFDLEQ